ncbi:MAG: DUF2935 domain-containing protein [Bacilli bacterium]|nr:DUF2935 domain-containing protein [Bacilli bacterium]
MNYQDYIRLSLQTHLFFDRIMKEHSLFLELSLPEKNRDLKQKAHEFQNQFEKILEKIVYLSNGNISNQFMQSGEFVTKNTLDAENMTNHFFGDKINTNITNKELNLQSGVVNIDRRMIGEISKVNQETLPIIQNLIHFKNDILNKVLSCQVYSTNYPSLIQHIINEAKMYYDILSRIDRGQILSSHDQYDEKYFWNMIMKEHAEFIRGLLDPSEKDLILTADKFAEEYQMIMKRYANNPDYFTSASLKETANFQSFQIAGEEGILNCKIKSIIIPLLADHVLREANHYLRILKEK